MGAVVVELQGLKVDVSEQIWSELFFFGIPYFLFYLSYKDNFFHSVANSVKNSMKLSNLWVWVAKFRNNI